MTKKRKNKVSNSKRVRKTANDNDRNRGTGIGHAYESNSSCSKRTRIFKECTDRGNNEAYDKVDQSRNLDGFGTTLKVSEKDTNEFRNYVDSCSKTKGSHRIFFSGKKKVSDDKHILEQCENATVIGLVNNKESPIRVNNKESPIRVYDTPDQLNCGITCIDETTKQFVFMIVPRGKVCGKNKVVTASNPARYIDALDEVEACERNLKGERGKLRNIVFEGRTSNENYQNLFVKADRGGKGLIRHIPNKLTPNSVNEIEKWKHYITSIINEVVPTEILKGVRAGLVKIGLDTRNVTKKCSQKDCLEDGELPDYVVENEKTFQNNPNMDLLPALAVSRNVSLSMHTDNDASLSVVIVYRREDINHRQKHKTFLHRCEILKYFTFGCGISVGLRSGDILIFNPQIEHCISTNTDVCDMTGVMTTSHYFKSSVIGLNDNDIAIKQE